MQGLLLLQKHEEEEEILRHELGYDGIEIFNDTDVEGVRMMIVSIIAKE